MIKAIETIYKGYRFRSRLEARWAVFFDTLGVHFQYEPEGFDLVGVWYLPDFWLPEQKCWIEVKGNSVLSDEETHKCYLLCRATRSTVFIARDIFSSSKEAFPLSVRWFYLASESIGFYGVRNSFDATWAECLRCGAIQPCDVCYDSEGAPQCVGLTGVGGCNCAAEEGREFFSHTTSRLKAAYLAARQARFEHSGSDT
jgi:hypothetical protein